MFQSNLAGAYATNGCVKQAGDSKEHPAIARALEQLDLVTDAIAEQMHRDEPSSLFPKLSIVIPVYNERDTILQVLSNVRNLNVDKQIVVVDDGSTDGTRELLATLSEMPEVEVFFHSMNQGKGAALQTGFRIASGEIVIVQDADLEYNPEDILRVIEPIERGDTCVAFGSRYLEKSHQNSSFIHRFGNWGLTAFSNWMNGLRLTDMETCYKAFRREILQGMTIEQRRFGFEPEITAKIARQGLSIVEVPIRYHARSWIQGKKIGLRDLISALYCIVRYRWFR